MLQSMCFRAAAIGALVAFLPLGAAYAQTPPELALDPAGGASPQTVAVTGTGFFGFGPVDFTIDGEAAGTSEADAEGQVVIDLTIVGKPGAVVVKACQADADGASCAVTANATFTITAPPTTTTTTTQPSTTTTQATTTTSTTAAPPTTVAPTTTLATPTTVAPVTTVAEATPTTLAPESQATTSVPAPDDDAWPWWVYLLVALGFVASGLIGFALGRRRFQTMSNVSKAHADEEHPDFAWIPTGTEQASDMYVKIKGVEGESEPAAAASGGGGANEIRLDDAPGRESEAKYPENMKHRERAHIQATDGELDVSTDPASEDHRPHNPEWTNPNTSDPGRAGEKGGTVDINIGVGELQETGVETRGWDYVDKKPVEGASDPEDLGRVKVQFPVDPPDPPPEGHAPGTELDDIGAPQAEAPGTELDDIG